MVERRLIVNWCDYCTLFGDVAQSQQDIIDGLNNSTAAFQFRNAKSGSIAVIRSFRVVACATQH